MIPLVIEELWAWISVGVEGEGVVAVAVTVPRLGWMPLVGADRERIESMRDAAQQTADASGAAVSLVRFSSRELVETLRPAGGERS